uniref:Uncharacterized protein n=1 Tax=Arundo donax TaxID=35708 RepID=A0A0A8Y4A6_ARUDO
MYILFIYFVEPICAVLSRSYGPD